MDRATLRELLDRDEWAAVPDRVVALLKRAAPMALELRVVAPAGDLHDRAWWNPDDDAVHVQSVKEAAWRLVLRPGVIVSPRPPEGDSWVLIKRAAIFGPITRLQHGAQRLLGGPNPMASAITGGLVGAGLGYGAGWLGEQFLPEEEFEPGKLRRAGLLLGAGLGAAPGLYAGTVQARIPEAGGSTAPGLYKYLRPKPWLSDYSWRGPGTGKEVQAEVHPLFKEAAGRFGDEVGFLHAPTIPVDAFNRAIWNDVGAAPNPYGTKSPWGDDSQKMHTPPNVASFASGVVTGAGAATGQPRVSPLQVAATAGMAAGVGYLGGLTLGKVFGALAGLRPEAQHQLQRTGAWAGLVTGAVKGLFD